MVLAMISVSCHSSEERIISFNDLPVHAQQFKKLQALVWSIADTLRDKSNLQVDGFRPVTLMLDFETSIQHGVQLWCVRIKRQLSMEL